MQHVCMVLVGSTECGLLGISPILVACVLPTAKVCEKMDGLPLIKCLKGNISKEFERLLTITSSTILMKFIVIAMRCYALKSFPTSILN